MHTSTTPLFERLLRVTARSLAMPIALLFFVEQGQVSIKASFGLADPEIMTAYLQENMALIFSNQLVVHSSAEQRKTHDRFIHFYAGAPFITPDGSHLGMWCVMDDQAHQAADLSDLTLLSEFASLALNELELRREIEEARTIETALYLRDRAIATTKDGITIADITQPDQPLIYANLGFEQITGYSHQDVIGKNCRFLQGPETDPQAVQQIRDAIRNKEACKLELLNYRKDGVAFWNSLSMTPIFDEDGHLTHYIGVQSDITKRKLVEIALQQAQEAALMAKEEAEQANQAKSNFLSRMSHELRTPLNAILGFAQLLELDVSNDNQKMEVGQILKAGHHLLDLINQVLDIARIESGRLTLSLEPVAVGGILRESIDLVRPLLGYQNISLSQQIIKGQGHGNYIQADRQRLKQVMLNLLSNAIKYNRNGGKITVSCERTIEQRLWIKVTDTGLGIPAHKLEHIFTPFERLGAEQSNIEGTGLGLPLSKQLVEAMGGMITVESIEGHGSTFGIEFPLAKNPTSQLIDINNEEDSLFDRSSVSHTVVYIEDNESNLRLVENIIARRPTINFISTMEGLMGLELVQEYQPDLVLLDLHLSDIAGEELLLTFKADPQTAHIPVIIISADSIQTHIDHIMACGADEYLTKPLNVKHFLKVIDEHLGKKSI